MGILSKATVHLHDAVDKMAGATVPAEKWLEEQGETLTVGSKTVLNGASKFIAAHPLQSLGLALAAGYLLSRLTR